MAACKYVIMIIELAIYRQTVKDELKKIKELNASNNSRCLTLFQVII